MSSCEPLNDEEMKVMSEAAHRLPYRSSFRGTTNIRAGYFPTIQKLRKRSRDDANSDTPADESDAKGLELTSSFRGRKLMGRVISPPSGFTAAVMLFPKDPSCELDVDEELSASSRSHRDAAILLSKPKVWVSIPQLVFWEHDRAPTSHEIDSIAQWAKLASVIHHSVDAS
mmetsp:Transcript_35710/g.41645  ORF Transcript_35710/g.41645 Transcript_35710/m.41645 type:complete len:171 (-) Transcript_35710:54-566(-)